MAAAGANPEVQEDAGQSFEDEAELVAVQDRVRAALGRIPTAQRQVLEMMYFEGKTQLAVARELGIPLGTVKSRTLLGMRRLRDMLLGGSE
jgi:RNA polymerase sigma-70 factor (ECF subfamily)